MKKNARKKINLFNFRYYGLLLLGSFILCSLNTRANSIEVSKTAVSGAFPLVATGNSATIVIDNENDAEVVSIVAEAFSKDVELITGIRPEIKSELDANMPVVVGTLGQSTLIDQLVAKGKISTQNIAGEWETFCITVVNNPFENVEKALVIYGSDPRGTAFGVFEFSKIMGVSPWVYWADIMPEKSAELYVTEGESIFGPPSVQYRGIFINDEDWGLQPWAAKHMDPTINDGKGDIGPRTYEKVFELMLRLKSNYIWPGMHPCTKAFWYYKENPELARKYNIVLGSSHCEQMLRNNVDEWSNNFQLEYPNESRGQWNWATNSTQITRYWEDRVKESINNDAIYTLGMRGIHDSGMPGYSTNSEKATAMKAIIAKQRNMLSTNLGKAASEVPQIFCPYKEALTLYRLGLDLADDVTLLWADDNFGYVRQLSNPQEQLRSGGSGVYYHFSYWGIPDDFLWLSTISPTLTSLELTRAYEMNAKKIWIFNVGDIKPHEAEMQFALDFSWDVNTWTPEKAHEYPIHWAREIFGDDLADEIGKVKDEFYRLAATGKPEHIINISYTEKEILQRIEDYEELTKKVKEIELLIPERLQDAYFQLIAYPVEACANMNEKILLARLSHTYAAQGKQEAIELSTRAMEAYQNIIILTRKYNKEIADGKWDGMMDYAPRGLARFYEPSVASEDQINENKFPESMPDSIKVIAGGNFSAKASGVVEIKGLGIENSSATVWPLDMTTYTASNITTAPYVEYNVSVIKGSNIIEVRCLPNFPLYQGLSLRYAISIDGATSVFHDIKVEAEAGEWGANLRKGYISRQNVYQSNEEKDIKVRIYFPDPGVVISSLAIINSPVDLLTEKIVNPSFEYKSANVMNDGTVFRGTPYGWSEIGDIASGNNTSYGIRGSDATNYSGTNYCWYNRNTSPYALPENFELYQTVTGLESGEYLVRCRLAAPSGYITTVRLFANNNVQYYGKESDYGLNLTEGEINSFAGITPVSSLTNAALSEMVVRVLIAEGEDLRLGIRSSNKGSDGNAIAGTSTMVAGSFKVDHFRLEHVRSLPSITDLKNELKALIDEANELYSSTQEGTSEGNYPTQSRKTFNDEIQAAENIYQDDDASLNDIVDAISKLETAISNYKKSVITFTAYIVNPSFEYSSEGVLNNGAVVRADPYGWTRIGAISGNSFGTSADATNIHEKSICWYNSTPMPQSFELSQTVSGLPAGDYTVKCRLAIFQDRITNQRLFANNNVQYYGDESEYENNLTAGENNTFAGWIATASAYLREMEVDVTLAENEPLKLGIRSSNVKSDGSLATADNSGWFKLDHFRLEAKYLTVSIKDIEDSPINKNKDIQILKTNGGVDVLINVQNAKGRINVYSVMGHLVQSIPVTSDRTHVSLTNKGVYILQVELNTEKLNTKVIVN